jgi:hypothetical protein
VAPAHSPERADERPHPPGGPGWEESWSFDFATADGALGGFVRLALRPGEGRAWYWAYLAGRRRALVVVRDHDVDLPRGRALEVRGPGLWAQVTCEAPLDHWSAGLEASGVALDDPTEAWRGERGDPVPLGLDLQWESEGEARPLGGEAGYAQPASVHGEVLVGAERIDVEARGWRSHAWGRPPWEDGDWWWAGVQLDDGGAVCAAAPGQGWTWSSGGGVPPTATGAALARPSGDGGFPGGAVLTAGSLELAAAPLAWAVVPCAAGVGVGRALCSWSGGGRRGGGWREWLARPAPGQPGAVEGA